jgi:hypothetical protein
MLPRQNKARNASELVGELFFLWYQEFSTKQDKSLLKDRRIPFLEDTSIRYFQGAR